MSHIPKHLRINAQKHHEAHQRVKKLVNSYASKKRDPILPAFINTFIAVIIIVVIGLNTGNIIRFFTRTNDNNTKTEVEVQTYGIQTGVLGSYKIAEQASASRQKLLATIPTKGSIKGAKASNDLSAPKPSDTSIKSTIESAIESTTIISNGQQLTSLPQSKARSLQKSILATYYLGEKTVDLNSTIETDSKILSQISNTLSVDLFAYLNQAISRADALDEYINLLTILQNKTNKRIKELQTKINFLTSNFQIREQKIQQSEQTFFDNLKIFNGPDAKTKLADFVGLRKGSVEIRAKIGAYEGLRNYYKFFQPKIVNLLTTIRANRDPLIAGVKVVEVQNMSLPLIIRKR